MKLTSLRALCERKENDGTLPNPLSLTLLLAILRSIQRSRHSYAMFKMRHFAISQVQSEALMAAESLATMNEKFIAEIENTPLKIGLHSVNSAIGKVEYKLKLRALTALGSKSLN